MSFIFASSHLPEDNRPQAEEEEDDDTQPMQRSGMVRAFSHLPHPARAAPAEPTGPPPQRGVQASGARLQPVVPAGLSTPHADGVAAAKASGVFDVVRHQFNQSSAQHFMDEDGNLRPRNGTGPPTSPTPPTPPARPAWTTEAEAPAEHEPDEDADDGTATHAPEGNSPWYMPPITLKDLHPQGDDYNPDPGFSVPPEKPARDYNPDPGFSVPPEKPARDYNPDPGFFIHPSKAGEKPTPDAGFELPQQDSHDATGDTSTEEVAPAPRSSLPYGRLFEKRPTPGYQTQATGGPGGLADKAEFRDLVYRPQGSPAEQGDQRRGFFQTVDKRRSSPQQSAQLSPIVPQLLAATTPPAPRQQQGVPSSTAPGQPPAPPKPADQQQQASIARNMLKGVPENERLEKAKALIDGKAMFINLTRGPQGLHDWISNEAGFSKNIQTDFLDNYLNGAPQKQYKMSHRDVYDSNIGLNLDRSADFQKALKDNTTGERKEWTFKASVPAIAGTSATLGNFAANVEMKVTSQLIKDKNGNTGIPWTVEVLK